MGILEMMVVVSVSVKKLQLVSGVFGLLKRKELLKYSRMIGRSGV